MQRRTERKSARGGRALLTGLGALRPLRADNASVLWLSIGPCAPLPSAAAMTVMSAAGYASALEVLGSIVRSPLRSSRLSRSTPVEAAIQAADQSEKADADIRQALCRELEEARYEATLASRRYEVVDPTKRLVARELETRWNTALERVAHLEDRIARHDAAAALRPKIDRAALIALARDLPTTWNARGTDARTKQRITHILIREVILDRDDATNEAIVMIHWNGGRHTELRVSRGRTGRYPSRPPPEPR